MIYDEVRIAYLSARERPKEYEDEWGNLIDKLRQKWDGTGKLGDLMRDRMDENLLFSEKAKDAGGGKAKRIYQLIKDMRNDADITQDPFRKKYGDKLVDELIKSKELFAMFLHWAYRDHKKALPIEHWEMHGKEIDNFTSGYQGLDLTFGNVSGSCDPFGVGGAASFVTFSIPDFYVNNYNLQGLENPHSSAF